MVDPSIPGDHRGHGTRTVGVGAHGRGTLQVTATVDVTFRPDYSSTRVVPFFRIRPKVLGQVKS